MRGLTYEHSVILFVHSAANLTPAKIKSGRLLQYSSINSTCNHGPDKKARMQQLNSHSTRIMNMLMTWLVSTMVTISNPSVVIIIRAKRRPTVLHHHVILSLGGIQNFRSVHVLSEGILTVFISRCTTRVTTGADWRTWCHWTRNW